VSAARIRALLVDDEVLGRLALRQALAAHPQVEIVGECGNASEASDAIKILDPNLMFLDIQMPGMDGFTLLRHLSPDRLPLIVFATAFGEHALRAFDANAIDYVLKPIDQARFDRAMARVKQRLSERPVRAAQRAVSDDGFAERISVRVGEHIRLIPVAEIDWMRADGNHVHIHAAGSCFLHRASLRDLLAALDPARFLRIHRGTAVSVDRIREVHPLFQGNAEVVLRDGTRLELSRRFRAAAREVLGLR
jgi:two-component system LytT family response regulator